MCCEFGTQRRYATTSAWKVTAWSSPRGDQVPPRVNGFLNQLDLECPKTPRIPHTYIEVVPRYAIHGAFKLFRELVGPNNP